MLEQELELGSHDRLDGAGGSSGLLAAASRKLLGERLHPVGDERLDQLGLAREVVVDGALGHARAIDDLVDGGVGEPPLADELHRGVEQLPLRRV